MATRDNNQFNEKPYFTDTELYERIVDYISNIEQGEKITSSRLQRQFRIGYPKAQSIMNKLTEDNFLTYDKGTNKYYSNSGFSTQVPDDSSSVQSGVPVNESIESTTTSTTTTTNDVTNANDTAPKTTGKQTVNAGTTAQAGNTTKIEGIWGKSGFNAPQESETARKYKAYLAGLNGEEGADLGKARDELIGHIKSTAPEEPLTSVIAESTEHSKKAKMGGWGAKMKKAGAIGLGAIVAGGVIANLMGNGGQQTNAQLYGQQPIY